MGYLSSTHIQSFVKGQTVKELSFENGFARLVFESGESLRLYGHPGARCIIIATPYDATGEVKQSIEITGND